MGCARKTIIPQTMAVGNRVLRGLRCRYIERQRAHDSWPGLVVMQRTRQLNLSQNLGQVGRISRNNICLAAYMFVVRGIDEIGEVYGIVVAKD